MITPNPLNTLLKNISKKIFSIDEFKLRADQFETQKDTPYVIIHIDLSVARNNEKLSVSGDLLKVIEATDNSANIDARLNFTHANPIPMFRYRAVYSFFHTVFITNAAQAGKTLDLLIGVKQFFDIRDFFFRPPVTPVTPALPFNSVQFNNAGAFGGSANLTFNPATNLLNLIGNFTATGNIRISSDTGLFQAGNVITDYTFGWNAAAAIHTISAGYFLFTGGFAMFGSGVPTGNLSISNGATEMYFNYNRGNPQFTSLGVMSWFAAGNMTYSVGNGRTLVFEDIVNGFLFQANNAGISYFRALTIQNGVNLIFGQVGSNFILGFNNNRIYLGTGNASYITYDGDLYLQPRAVGAGYVKFGTYLALAAEVITGYITIKDAAGNLRKLAVIT